MSIVLDLRPEVEQRVREEAGSRGMSPESYLASVIEARMAPRKPSRATQEEFEAYLEALAEGTDDIPVLPPEALTREAIYGEHD